MTPQERFIANQRLRDEAIARAHELRAQAIAAFWSAVVRAVTTRIQRIGRHQRRSRRAVEVA